MVEVKKTRVGLVLAVNLLIFGLVVYAWFVMMFRMGDGTLSGTGLSSLRYYTVLSNLLEGLAALITVVFTVLILAGKASELPRWVTLLCYAGTTSVSLTFVTVMVYLGPVFGFNIMFNDANLYFHLLIPLFAIMEALFLSKEKLRFKDSFVATLPTLLYGVWYIINNLANGREGNDIYYLFYFGPAASVLFFIGFMAVAWGIALLLRLPRKAP